MAAYVGQDNSRGLTCLTQIALWAVMTGAIVTLGASAMDVDLNAVSGVNQMATAEASGVEAQLVANKIVSAMSSINWVFIFVMFIVYFIGGYLLYSSLFAAIGAAVDNADDTNQFLLPISIVVLFALYAGIYSAQNPDGRWLSGAQLFRSHRP